MVSKRKLLISQKLSHQRVKQHIESAQRRVAEYRALVSKEGITSQRLIEIDQAKENCRNQSAQAANNIKNTGIKKSEKNRKQWHHKKNTMRKEWEKIYQDMRSDYSSCPNRCVESKRTELDQSNREQSSSSLENKGDYTHSQAKKKNWLTKKGQPIMNLKIAELYEKCAMETERRG